MGPLHGLSAWTLAEGTWTPAGWAGGQGRQLQRPWRPEDEQETLVEGGWKSVNTLIQHRCSPYECQFKKTSARSIPGPNLEVQKAATGPRHQRDAS